MTVTRLEADLLRFIHHRIEATGVCPSRREMRAHFGESSNGALDKRIDSLEALGHIRRNRGKARNIEVILIPRALALPGTSVPQAAPAVT